MQPRRDPGYHRRSGSHRTGDTGLLGFALQVLARTLPLLVALVALEGCAPLDEQADATDLSRELTVRRVAMNLFTRDEVLDVVASELEGRTTRLVFLEGKMNTGLAPTARATMCP